MQRCKTFMKRMEVSRCRMCDGTANPDGISLLDSSQHALQWAINNQEMELDNGLTTSSVCESCIQNLNKQVSFKATCEKSKEQSVKNQLNTDNEPISSQRQLRSSSRNKNIPDKTPLNINTILNKSKKKSATYKNKKSPMLVSNQTELNKKYKLKELKIAIVKLNESVLNTYIKRTEPYDLSKVKIENMEINEESHTQVATGINSTVDIKVEANIENMKAVRTALLSKLLERSAKIKKENETTSSKSELLESKKTSRKNKSPDYKPEPEIETDFKCKKCIKQFSNSLDKHIHMAIAHTTKLQSNYQCTVCSTISKNKKNLLLHIRYHHSGTIYHCKNCSYQTQSKYNLKLHKRKHIVVINECNICKRVFTARSNLYHHKKYAHSNIRNFKCEICLFAFKMKRHLTRHVNDSHLNKGKLLYACTKCPKKFDNKYILRKHVQLVHIALRPFKCDICKKCYKTKKQIKDHIISHSNYRPYKCHQCPMKFKLLGLLKVHMVVHENIYRFTCNICSKKFKHSTSYRAHKYVHIESRPFNCEKCSKSFKTSQCLKTHQLSHINVYNYKCGICSKKIKNKTGLKLHMIIMHSKDLPFKCDICKKGCKTKQYLTRHIRSKHK